MSRSEPDYFDLFVGSAEFACKLVREVRSLIDNYESVADMRAEMDRLHAIEHAADHHFHFIYEMLSKSFITPLEREDILTLAQSIDDITDSIEAVAYSLYLLNIKDLRPELFETLSLIEESCNSLKEALEEFRKFKKSKLLSDLILKVNALEEKGDRLYQSNLRKLYTEETEVLMLIKWREIYEKLEECLDACENAADIMEGVYMKNS